MIMIKPELGRILDIVADLSQKGLSDLEVRNHLNELDWLHLVKEALPRPSHEEFRLWNVTEKGLQEISHQDPMQP